jgi:phosphate uptake regulator
MAKCTKENLLPRKHVLRMTMLSQRAVDYSIKAYALNSLESCRLVAMTKDDLCELEASIGDRGRSFLAAGATIDAHSPLACSSLRIFSSLRVIFAAAIEIAQNVKSLAPRRREATFPQTVETGNFVNGLIRLCSIALFDQNLQLAKQVLQIEGGRRRIDLALYRARLDLLRRFDTNCKYELAIVNCIGHIAEQVYETAEGIIAWLESRGCVASRGTKTMSARWGWQHRFFSEQLTCRNSAHALMP